MEASNRIVHVGDIAIANHLPFVLIAGPCQIESRAHALEVAAALAELSRASGVRLIYKSSFDKANRTSAGAARGVGLQDGLAILAEVRERTGLPVLTDVHAPEHCAPAAEAVDVLQIPAFLCRQTDLLLAAGATGKPVNVKKGQFLAPWDMQHVAAKIAGTGNQNILLCERGVTFGYNTLVTDMRSLVIMARTGYPVVFDATHSVQQPGGLGGVVRRAAGIRPGAGARGAGGRRGGGVHRDTPGPGPRAERRTEHDTAAGDAGAGYATEGVRCAGEGWRLRLRDATTAWLDDGGRCIVLAGEGTMCAR